MIPQMTLLYARTADGVFLVIGWMFDGGRANDLDAVGVQLGSPKPVRGCPIGEARFFSTLDEAKRVRA